MFRREMLYGSLQLSATDRLASTVEVGTLATNARSADRALFRHAERGVTLFPRYRNPSGDCGNHIACPFYLDGIADSNIFPRYFIGVVQRGPADGDAANLHRFQ